MGGNIFDFHIMVICNVKSCLAVDMLAVPDWPFHNGTDYAGFYGRAADRVALIEEWRSLE